MIRVLVADDQRVVREGLALVLALMPGSRWPGLLRERLPGSKVIVLTTYSDDRSVLDPLRAGAAAI